MNYSALIYTILNIAKDVAHSPTGSFKLHRIRHNIYKLHDFLITFFEKN